jgi:ferrous iron transport protein B
VIEVTHAEKDRQAEDGHHRQRARGRFEDAADDDAAATSLGPKLAADWSLATALAFLAWFVFAPQCISTIAVTRRETNGWKWPIFMVTYLFALAYAAAGITYWTARSFGL